RAGGRARGAAPGRPVGAGLLALRSLAHRELGLVQPPRASPRSGGCQRTGGAGGSRLSAGDSSPRGGEQARLARAQEIPLGGGANRRGSPERRRSTARAEPTAGAAGRNGPPAPPPPPVGSPDVRSP